MEASKYFWNPYLAGGVTSEVAPEDPRRFHQSLPGYRPTPLVALPELASRLGLGRIWIKDESQRFDLMAFKVLGASYAIFKLLEKAWQKTSDQLLDPADFRRPGLAKSLGVQTLTAATDGNHGRAVAWTARTLGLEAVIFVPRDMVSARIRNLEKLGARVVIVDGTYDQAVARCVDESEAHGWHVISDTSWPGYTEIPTWVVAGYSTMFREIDEQLPEGTIPDLVFLQTGVGSFACAGISHYKGRTLGARPKLICLEPLEADCLLESALSGQGGMAKAKGNLESLMSGLNCGTPSLIAWPVLKAGIDLFLAVDDAWSLQAMYSLYHPRKGDDPVYAGESGAAGLAGLLALTLEPALKTVRQRLKLGPNTSVLLINTEGGTDPEGFSRVVEDHRRFGSLLA